MKFITPVFILMICTLNSYAADADSLIVKLDKHQLNKADTLFIECEYQYQNPAQSKITLNVIIENIEKTKSWRFRYPLMQGKTTPAFIIDSGIANGSYAIHFSVQNDFLRIKGKVRDPNPKSKGFNYLMLGKNKASYIGFLNMNEKGEFATQKLLFEDTARFVFSEVGKKNEQLFIDLQTNLDSAYIPLAQQIAFIQIGPQALTPLDSAALAKYKWTHDEQKIYTLNEVVVKSNHKKKVELFDEMYASGLFKFGFPTIFDGLEHNDIGYSMDVFSFLQGRVAGLKIQRDGMNYTLSWRGDRVDIFLDEFRVDEDFASVINTNDIAMIKVYAPLSGGPRENGTIAIYTKRGYFQDNSKRRYNFLVNGYAPLTSTWK